jgi:hypothetical protein
MKHFYQMKLFSRLSDFLTSLGKLFMIIPRDIFEFTSFGVRPDAVGDSRAMMVSDFQT